MPKIDSRKRPTIKDIAKEANVSPATVSIVMRDKETPRVRPETRQRIIAIAAMMDYKPNHAARSLVGKGSCSIGLVITTLRNPFYAEIAQDIIDRAREKGYGLTTSSVGSGGLENERHAIETLLDHGIDGLIIGSAVLNDPVIYQLSKQGIPFVLINRSVAESHTDPPTDQIVLDNKRGGFLATQHLVKMGHKSISLLSGPQMTSTGYDRQCGVIAALEDSGIKAEPSMILYGDFTLKSGYELTRQIMRSKRRPSAIIAGNDHMAVGVLSALADENIKVPEDIAVIGFDDINIASLPGIDLTTVSQKKTIMGQLAVDHLIERIRGESAHLAKRIMLDPILVIRRTCGYHIWEGRSQDSHDKLARENLHTFLY